VSAQDPPSSEGHDGETAGLCSLEPIGELSHSLLQCSPESLSEVIMVNGVVSGFPHCVLGGG
jgi:hypothetical protein